MLAKLFNKHSSDSQDSKALIDLNPQVIAHYGIPSTASCLAYDSIQQLLAVGTLDGRIKIIGSANIEGLLMSPKEIPFKNLEFLQNQGFLIAVSNENDIQVWDLEHRCIASVLQWESNITAFSVIQETSYMYLGDDCGLVSVLKYDFEERKIVRQQYSIPAHSAFDDVSAWLHNLELEDAVAILDLAGRVMLCPLAPPQSMSRAARIPMRNVQSVVGVLPQPCSRGDRVLLAYDSGAIFLWDVTKDQLVCVRGWNNDQLNDGDVDNSANIRSNEEKNQTLGCGQEAKEIVCLCWASSDGSILAVGYMDGDIMLWKLSDAATSKDPKAGKPTDNAIKLQLSSAERRFPIIVLHWSASGAHADHGGQLFVYGGDEIGSAEVLTILNLEWSPKKDAFKNVMRANVTLQGSFADMILLQNLVFVEDTGNTALFLLTSPGQLQYYDSPCLSRLMSDQDKSCIIPLLYESVVPMSEPYLTVGRFISVLGNIKCSEALSKLQETYPPSDKSSKWPLNGGVPCHLSLHGERKVERLYIAGYQDGLVRIWDATYPILSPIFIIDPEVRLITNVGAKGSVSALDFSSESLNIAIGTDSGTVHLHSLTRNSNEIKLHVVSGTKSEACDLDQENGSNVSAMFTLSASPVTTLRYTNLGARLAVGYKSGQVAMLNLSSLSVLFFIDSLSSPDSHIVSFSPALLPESYGLKTILDQSVPHGKIETGKELICALTDDLHFAILDSSSGDVVGSVSEHRYEESTAISIYILDGSKCITEVSGGESMQFLSQENNDKAEASEVSGHDEGNFDVVDQSKETVHCSMDLQILVCSTDVLLVYSLKSMMQGHVNSICEVPLQKTSCWTTIFKRKEEEYGLLLFYETGSIEIRSLPNLEVLGELSLLSILRWNFRTGMNKTMSCTEEGQITLVNGCEFVILSLLACDNDFRIPESLPCLHDEALAAALDLNYSPDQKINKEFLTGSLPLANGLMSYGFACVFPFPKLDPEALVKEQEALNHLCQPQLETSSGIFGGMVKGLRASKEAQSTNAAKVSKTLRSALDKVFASSKPYAFAAPKDAGEAVELNIEDINIEEPLRVSPIAHKSKDEVKGTSTERNKLLEGGTSETKPKQRTIDEIKAKYRKDTSSATASAASAASEAKNKLLERQEKLERIGQNSEELRNSAENFSSMAKELAKKMENRKWWQL